MDNWIKVEIPPSAAGKRLSVYLAEAGYNFNAPCGSNGICGKCEVYVVSGNFYTYGTDCDALKFLLPSDKGMIKACRAICSDKAAEIMIPKLDNAEYTENLSNEADNNGIKEHKFSVALDIGTTTLALDIIDSKTHKTIKSYSALNPQKSFGADVMSRITASVNGNLQSMHNLLINSINQMLMDFKSCFKQTKISFKTLSVVGNATMLHIFCKVSPDSMGMYPYLPQFKELKCVSGSEINLPFSEVLVLPSVSAFIGADAVAGAVAVDLLNQENPSLIIDIGTNSEMMLFTGKNNGSRLFGASAAAGPAFEGAGISTGVGGVLGAVCKVSQGENGEFTIKCIGDAEPIGICGSGLIDLISFLLKTKRIDNTGKMQENEFVYAKSNGVDLSLTQGDIRAVQLAKSAIRAGIESLTEKAELKLQDINTVFIAGGLGQYMDISNAIKVGIIPPEFETTKVITVGNSALTGAKLFLENIRNTKHQMIKISEQCEVVDLNTSETFNKRFIDCMMFE